MALPWRMAMARKETKYRSNDVSGSTVVIVQPSFDFVVICRGIVGTFPLPGRTIDENEMRGMRLFGMILII